jgi:deoxycytidylate deaminase
MIGPRKDGILSWDELFMSLALIGSFRSKDPSTQNGAVIVSPMNVIIALVITAGHVGLIMINYHGIVKAISSALNIRT